jgi:hypothetical protein
MFVRQSAFTIAPRNVFRKNSMLRTGYTTHAIRKEDWNVPERGELLETGNLGGILSRTRTITLGTNAFAILASMNLNDDLLTGRISLCPNIVENEGLVIRNRIQYSFDLHLGWKRKEYRL